MHRALIVSISLLVASGSAVADEAAAPRTAAVLGTKKPARTVAAAATPTEAKAEKPKGEVQMSGMSKLLDDSTQPVDKDVFMRELAYYEIKTDSK